MHNVYTCINIHTVQRLLSSYGYGDHKGGCMWWSILLLRLILQARVQFIESTNGVLGLWWTDGHGAASAPALDA